MEYNTCLMSRCSLWNQVHLLMWCKVGSTCLLSAFCHFCVRKLALMPCPSDLTLSSNMTQCFSPKTPSWWEHFINGWCVSLHVDIDNLGHDVTANINRTISEGHRNASFNFTRGCHNWFFNCHLTVAQALASFGLQPSYPSSTVCALHDVLAVPPQKHMPDPVLLFLQTTQQTFAGLQNIH